MPAWVVVELADLPTVVIRVTCVERVLTPLISKFVVLGIDHGIIVAAQWRIRRTDNPMVYRQRGIRIRIFRQRAARLDTQSTGAIGLMIEPDVVLHRLDARLTRTVDRSVGKIEWHGERPIRCSRRRWHTGCGRTE